MSWNEEAATWDEKEAVRAYAGSAFENLVALADRGEVTLQEARVLDFGCGTGLLSEKLQAVVGEVVAIDPAEKMVAVLEEKIRSREWSNVRALALTLEQAQGRAGSLLSEPFDLVVASSSLAFVPDYAAEVDRLAKLLRPGGALVAWDWEVDPNADEAFGVTREAIEDAFSSAGLRLRSVRAAFEMEADGHVMKPLLAVGHR